MLRTAIASLLIVVCGWAGADWLTHGFAVWTDEGARRLEVALSPIAAPPVVVQGPGLPPTALPDVLDQGVTLVDFFYTRCQTVCLSLGSSMQQMQARLQNLERPGLRLLSISFDGAYDNSARLATYAQTLGADPAHWRFVHVPDAAQQAQLLARLGVVVIPNELGDFEHNAALLVFDAQARLVRIFDLAEEDLAFNYALHLARGPQRP